MSARFSMERVMTENKQLEIARLLAQMTYGQLIELANELSFMLDDAVESCDVASALHAWAEAEIESPTEATP
jgi:hypothetical protein